MVRFQELKGAADTTCDPQRAGGSPLPARRCGVTSLRARSASAWNGTGMTTQSGAHRFWMSSSYPSHALHGMQTGLEQSKILPATRSSQAPVLRQVRDIHGLTASNTACMADVPSCKASSAEVCTLQHERRQASATALQSLAYCLACKQHTLPRRLCSALLIWHYHVPDFDHCFCCAARCVSTL